jgi:hypothetical protein
MKLETKRTLYLTKEEKKVLSDFYWNFYEDDVVDDMYDTLRILADDPLGYPACEIKITD